MTLYLDGPTDGSQMIAESQRRRLSALSKVGVKLNLGAEGDPCTHSFGLAPLGVADRLRHREEFRGLGSGHKEHAVIIGQDQVLSADCPISDSGRIQRVFGTRGAEGQSESIPG